MTIKITANTQNTTPTIKGENTNNQLQVIMLNTLKMTNKIVNKLKNPNFISPTSHYLNFMQNKKAHSAFNYL